MPDDKLRDGLVKRGGTWSFVIRVRDPETGISKPRWRGGFPNREAAKAARDEARVKARRGEYVNPDRTTTGAYLMRWLDQRAPGLSPSTVATYRLYITGQINPAIGEIPLQSLRPRHIADLYQRLATTGGRNGTGHAPASISQTRRIVVKALADAVDVERLIPSNPAAKVRPPVKINPPDHSDLWTPDQLREFLEGCQGSRMHSFLRLAAYTGARRGELLGLRWRDLDLDAGVMHVRRSVVVAGGQRHIKRPKSGRVRQVTLDPETVAVMRRWRVEQAQERLQAGELWADREGVVFTRDDGSPIHGDTAIQLLRRVVTRLGLPRARLHDLRHIHATTLLRAGVPVHAVADRLGHTNPNVTLSVYAHAMPGDSEQAARVFAAAVSEGG